MRNQNREILKSLTLSALALMVIMLLPTSAEAVTVRRYTPPYEFGWTTAKKSGWLRGSYATAEASQDRSIGRWYIYLGAQSVVYIAHGARAEGEMGPLYPSDTEIYLQKGITLTVSAYVKFVGRLAGHLTSGVARLKVWILIYEYVPGQSIPGYAYLVDDYLAEDGIVIYPGERTYRVDHTVRASSYVSATLKIVATADSGQISPAGAWVNFGRGNYIELSWMEFMWSDAPPPAPGNGCPILSVFDGSNYVTEGLLDIHNPDGIDLVYNHTLTTEPAWTMGKYQLRLVEHQQTHSYIDQVKLYAMLEDGTEIELPLTYAWHSEDGNVLPQLLFSDERKTDTLGADLNNGTSQSIDLKFASPPNLQAVSFIFQIEGNNIPIKR